jgi:sortase family protein
MTRGIAGGRRVTGWVALATGSCALVAGATTLIGAGPPPDAGVVPASAAARTPAPATSSASPAGRPLAEMATAFSPTGVTIPALRVNAPVDPVGVTAGGALTIPEDPARLGWWIGSATPGSDRGTVLLAGHVDTATDGAGALFKLETLPMGASIDVRAGAKVVTYRTVARHSYSKRRLPPELFRADTAARLVLITCGGAFHHGSYADNVVVYAVPTT